MDLANGEVGEHIAPRRPFNPLAPLRPEVLHCYGVDFLSTKEVLDLFGKFDPKSVEWLDDSSCNLVFDDEDCLAKIFDGLGSGKEQAPEQEPWQLTKPLAVGAQKQRKPQASNRPLRAPRQVVLELRPATEADRKEARHSGHTDSVYYEHVKEQQAVDKLQQDRGEAKRAKKRMRQQRFIAQVEAAAQATEVTPGPTSQAELPSGESSASLEVVTGDKEMATGSDAAAAPPAAPARLGARGLLDPLLFLRTAPSTASGSSANDGIDKVAGVEDLAIALQKAEAEYAFLPALLTTSSLASAVSSTPTPQQGTPTPRGRQEDRNSDKERGRKRRPVSQEPRPVLEGAAAMPPPRRVMAMPEVEAFLRSKRVRCRRHQLKRTYRSIVYANQQKKKKGKPMDKELPPWEQYIAANGCNVGQLVHTVAWDVEGRWVLTSVPHPSEVDREKLAKAVMKPLESVRQRKLAEISKETGFPVFICLPFGFPKDSEGREPIILVDSSVTEIKKPLLFDCGSLGISMPASEFLRSTGATCVESLAGSSKKSSSTVSTAVVASSPFAKVDEPPAPLSLGESCIPGAVSVCPSSVSVDPAASHAPSGLSILEKVLAAGGGPPAVNCVSSAAGDATAEETHRAADDEMRPVLSTA